MHTGDVGTPLHPPPDHAVERDHPEDLTNGPDVRMILHTSPNPDPRFASPLPSPRRRSSKPRSPSRSRRTGKAVKATSTALYRYYDADDELLYVGMTGDLAEREVEHIRDSTWMDFAARSTIERFPTRDEAEEAERDAIRSEVPLFNIAHNDTPGATLRLVEYLIKQNRPDLLMPNISRG